MTGATTWIADDLIVAGYQHVVESGDFDDEWLSSVTGQPAERIAEVRRTLVDLQVIEPKSGRDDGWRAVSPRVAMSQLLTPMEWEARRRAADAAQLREVLQTLVPVHDAKVRSATTDLVEVVTGRAALRMLIQTETMASTELVLAMLDRADDLFDCLSAADEPGSRTTRAVFQHTARHHRPTVEVVTETGVPRMSVRTVDTLPMRMVVFDRRVCVLLDRGSADEIASGARDASAVVLRHPLLVGILAAAFDDTWPRGTPFGLGATEPMQVNDDVKRSVVRLLASGAKDDAVARRLGISVRSCRRYIADVMQGLGAASRFQAGVEAQRRRWV